MDVLIVDDSMADRYLLTRAIATSGIEVTLFEAESGAEALELLERIPMSVIFLDRRMPGMDGLDVLRAIRSARTPTRTVPVVVLFSSSALPSDVSQAYEHHANLYVTKPSDHLGYQALATSLLPTVLQLLSVPDPE